MTISNIEIIQNKNLPKFKPVKESMEIFIPNIIEHIPRRNGFIWCINGSGGSGKSSMLINFFKTNLYRKKFNNVFYYCPLVSFMSVDKHPFKNHKNVYHELNAENLQELYETLKSIKEGDDDEDDDEKKETEYNLVIIDDFADTYRSDKNVQKILSTMMIKARHLNTAFIFTLQSFFLFPRIFRKQLSYVTIFKPKSFAEWSSLSDELLNMKKDDVKKIYDFIFDAPYNHLDIDTTDNRIYKNFNLLNITDK